MREGGKFLARSRFEIRSKSIEIDAIEIDYGLGLIRIDRESIEENCNRLKLIEIN